MVGLGALPPRRARSSRVSNAGNPQPFSLWKAEGSEWIGGGGSKSPIALGSRTGPDSDALSKQRSSLGAIHLLPSVAGHRWVRMRPLWEQYLHCVTRSTIAAPCKLNQPRGRLQSMAGPYQPGNHQPKKNPTRWVAGRGLGLAWRGRALGRFTGSRASGLDSQRAPLIDQQLTNPPEPLGGNNTLHPLLDTLRGQPGSLRVWQPSIQIATRPERQVARHSARDSQRKTSCLREYPGPTPKRPSGLAQLVQEAL